MVFNQLSLDIDLGDREWVSGHVSCPCFNVNEIACNEVFLGLGKTLL